MNNLASEAIDISDIYVLATRISNVLTRPHNALVNFADIFDSVYSRFRLRYGRQLSRIWRSLRMDESLDDFLSTSIETMIIRPLCESHDLLLSLLFTHAGDRISLSSRKHFRGDRR